MEVLLLILGVTGLWAGSELTIDSAVKIARRYSLSEFFVGLAILSIGSDLPELAIAIDGGIRNYLGADVSDIIVGASLGSVAGQTGLVLGISGLLGFLILPKAYIYRHGAVRRVLKALAAGEGVALLIDQHMHSPDAIWVNFFRRPAATTSTLAALALRTGAAVIPVFEIGRAHV